MSAFIVSAERMTNCVAAIMAHVDEFGGISTRRASGRVPLARYDEAGQEIGDALWAITTPAIDHVEFQSEQGCNAAKTLIVSAMKGHRVVAECVKS